MRAITIHVYPVAAAFSPDDDSELFHWPNMPSSVGPLLTALWGTKLMAIAFRRRPGVTALPATTLKTGSRYGAVFGLFSKQSFNPASDIWRRDRIGSFAIEALP
jgi:hypothetical protein